jgi:hypothetical protein
MTEDQDETYRMLINDGIRFLESIGNYYGADRAIEVWNTLGPAIGDDVKGQVFMTMLSGGGNTMRIQISRPLGMEHNAVSVIKCIRAATGIGLKEAKDMWDSTYSRAVWLECQTREHARSARHELQQLGMRVH